MQQVVDLQDDPRFQALGVAVLSIAPDPREAWAEEAATHSIRTPLLTDAENRVAYAYGVMRWAMGQEPGHTFVLVDANGRVRWLRDYGAAEHGGLMYVPVPELTQQIGSRMAAYSTHVPTKL